MNNRRDILKYAAFGGAALAIPTPIWATEGADDYLRFVHPELREGAAQILAMHANEQPISDEGLPAFREGMKQWEQPWRTDVPAEKRTIKGAAGNPDVDIYIINADPANPRHVVTVRGLGYRLQT